MIDRIAFWGAREMGPDGVNGVRDFLSRILHCYLLVASISVPGREALTTLPMVVTVYSGHGIPDHKGP